MPDSGHSLRAINGRLATNNIFYKYRTAQFDFQNQFQLQQEFAIQLFSHYFFAGLFDLVEEGAGLA